MVENFREVGENFVEVTEPRDIEGAPRVYGMRAGQLSPRRLGTGAARVASAREPCGIGSRRSGVCRGELLFGRRESRDPPRRDRFAGEARDRCARRAASRRRTRKGRRLASPLNLCNLPTSDVRERPVARHLGSVRGGADWSLGAPIQARGFPGFVADQVGVRRWRRGVTLRRARAASRVVAITRRAGRMRHGITPACSRARQVSSAIAAVSSALVRLSSPVLRMSSAFPHERCHTERT